MAAEIPDGAVIVARAILNSSLWTMRNEDRIVAITCIAVANWKPKKWFDGEKEIVIGRGQFVRSLEKLAKVAHLSVQQVRTSVQHLENIEFLTRKSTSRYTVYTLPKYDFYQDLDNYSDSVNMKSNKRPTCHQQALNNKQEGEEGKEPTNGEAPTRGTPDEEGATAGAIPRELLDLPLYRGDLKLSRRLPQLIQSWQTSYPGVNVVDEIRTAHAWEISNPAKQKKDRPRFLNGWMKRKYDQIREKQATARAAAERSRASEPPTV